MGNPGTSFLDFIGPNDIVYGIALVKNSREMWDHDIKLHQLGSEVIDNPPELFTCGGGQSKCKERVYGIRIE
jgi:hypothetical protein